MFERPLAFLQFSYRQYFAYHLVLFLFSVFHQMITAQDQTAGFISLGRHKSQSSAADVHDHAVFQRKSRLQFIRRIFLQCLDLFFLQISGTHIQRAAKTIIFSSLIFPQIAGQFHDQHIYVVAFVPVYDPCKALVQAVLLEKDHVVFRVHRQKYQSGLLHGHGDLQSILRQNLQHPALVHLCRAFCSLFLQPPLQCAELYFRSFFHKSG